MPIIMLNEKDIDKAVEMFGCLDIAIRLKKNAKVVTPGELECAIFALEYLQPEKGSNAESVLKKFKEVQE